MSALLLLVPLRIEQLALGEPPGSRVIRTGMGPDRARIAAARALADDAPSVAVAGLCGGISPGVAAGDVICASELVREDGERIELSTAAPVAAALERRGLRVHTGPLLSSSRVLGAAERRSLAGDALAVDMESAWLEAGARGRPFAVVRVVADAAGRHLADPRIAIAALHALRNLRHVGGALSEWALEPASSTSLADPASTSAARLSQVKI